MKYYLLVLFILSNQIIFAQGFDSNRGTQKDLLNAAQFDQNSSSKKSLLKSFYKSKTDWQYIIDTTWGEGRPTSEKLEIFDLFWDHVDRKFGAFHNLDIDWAALRDHYRPIIENGISKGQFAGIMTHLSFRLKELHTKVFDMDVFNTPLKFGLPLLVLFSHDALFNNGHFGAGLTPISDSSLLVYKVIENHPLNLEPGDILLGYNGIPWKELYKELIEANLPVKSCPGLNAMQTGYPGSSERSSTHFWLNSAGLNWHMFDTIDIKKYGTNEIQHLSVLPLQNLTEQLFCSEQISPKGIPFPDILQGEWVTWGIIENTRIGYINLWGWGDPSVEQKFPEAVSDLIINHKVNGLIFDFRNATGGYPNYADPAFGLLFNETFDRLQYYMRTDDNNHFGMTPIATPLVAAFPVTSYLFDHPIAILTGPTAGSSGDINSLRLKYHPMARVFGKPTNTGFSGGTNAQFPYAEWLGICADGSFCLDDSSNGFLTHVGFDVDEEIWLNPDAVAKGEDNVIDRAVEWINNVIYPHDIQLENTYYALGKDTIHLSTIITNPNFHELSARSYIHNFDETFIDSIDLVRKSVSADGENWAADFNPVQTEEFFKISVTVFDESTSTLFTLPKATRFTTAGPVELDSVSTRKGFLNYYNLRPYVHNNGKIRTITKPKVKLICTDIWASEIGLQEFSLPNLIPDSTVTISSWVTVRVIDSLFPGYFNVKVEISCDGWIYWKDSVQVTITNIEDGIAQQLTFKLEQNYPNPFNPSTKISWQSPVGSWQTLKVFDLLGREVRTLVDEEREVGYYSIDFDASDLPSGVYFYQIKTGNYIETKKMILLR